MSTFSALIGIFARLGVAQVWTRPQRSAVTTLTSAASITPNAAASNEFFLTLAHNATIQNMENAANCIGQKGTIAGQQDATGGRTLTFASNWYPVGGNAPPALPSAPNAFFRIEYHIVTATRIDFAVLKVAA